MACSFLYRLKKYQKSTRSLVHGFYNIFISIRNNFFQFIISHSLAVSSCVLSCQKIELQTIEFTFINTRLKLPLIFHFACSQSVSVKYLCCSLLQSFAYSKKKKRFILGIIDEQCLAEVRDEKHRKNR